MLNALTLQEIMLAATFLLTFFNVWSNFKNARRNSVADDPTIAKIHIALAEVLKDIAHIKQAADQTTLRAEIGELKKEVAELKAKVDILMLNNTK